MEFKLEQEYKTINQLISSQTTINNLTIDENFHRLIHNELIKLGNVQSCLIHLACSTKKDKIGNAQDSNELYSCILTSENSFGDFQLLDEITILKISVQTKQKTYGTIFLKTTTDFTPEIMALLHNISVSIALDIENTSLMEAHSRFGSFDFAPKRDEIGEISGAKFTTLEIKKLEEEITNQRSFYEQKFLQSATSTQILDRDGWCIRINQKLSDLFGVRPENIEGHKYNIFEDGEIIRQGIDKILKRVIQEKKTEHWEVNFDIGKASESQQIEISNYKRVWFANSAFPILDKNGEVTHLIIQHEDISDRKQVEKALTASEEKFATAFRNSPVTIMLTTPYEGTFLDVNDTFLRDMEYTREEVIGKTTTDLGIFADYNDLLLILEELRKNNRVFGRECSFKSKSGMILTSLLSIVFLKINEKTVQLSIAIDITDRKRAELALKESEELFRRAFQTSPDSININRLADGMYVNINHGFTALMGYTEEEIIGKTSLEKNIWVNPDERSKLVKGLMNDGFVTNYEARFRGKDGSVVSGLMSASFIDLKGVPHILSMTRNINDIKMIRDELQLNEERFRRIFQEGKFCMALCSHDFHFLKVNDALCKMTGFSESELLELTFIDITHPDHLTGDLESITKLYEGSIQVYQSEKKYIRKDKQVVWGSINVNAMRDTHGMFLYFLAMINDITERKLAEEALKENNYRLDLAMHTANLAWWEMDIPTGNIRFHPRKSEMLGYLSENFKHYTDFMTLVHPDDYSRTMDSMHIYLSGKTEKYESEYRILTNSGEYRWFYDVGTIGKKDLAGSPVSLTGLVEDITERKNIEEEIRILNMHLEQKVNERTSQLLQANKELEAFSYSVSHDLRAPLRAIIGFTNILQEEHEDALNAEGKRICNVIHSSAWKLGKLIDDLLSFSRLSRGELQIAKINMEKLVHTIFMDLTSAEERSRILFKVEKLPTSSGDGAMIKQAWINLISNAIKYTSRNQSAIIEIGSTKQNMETIYFIRDNGIGFDMLYSDKLFGVFQRLHGSREFEGNGVGLAIVQRIIQKHGGRVWAEGKVNEGAIFYLTIPNSIKDE